MKRITVTITRPGLPRVRLTGLFTSTTAAIVKMLSCMPEDEVLGISAKVAA